MSTAYGIGGLISVPPPVLSGHGAPPSTFKGQLGQSYFDKSTTPFTEYIYNGSGWELGGASSLNQVTTDSGIAIPVAGNLNLLGVNTTTTSASGATISISPSVNGYPITPLVAGPIWFTGEQTSGYLTIADALTFLNDKFGCYSVYVQSNGHIIAEDIDYTRSTFNQNISIIGVCAQSNADVTGISILGMGLLPEDSIIRFESLGFTNFTGDAFQGTTLTSTGGSTGYLYFKNCSFKIGDAYILNLPNWETAIYFDNCGYINTSAEDGILNNVSGSAAVTITNSVLGAGTTHSAQFGGVITIKNSQINCPVVFNGTSSFVIENTTFTQPITLSGSSNGIFRNCYFNTGAQVALTMSSSGNVQLVDCIVNSSNNPSIAGAGAGTLTLAECTFTSNTALAATLTLGTTDLSQSSAYRTTPLATNVTLSDNTLSATGSDSNININITPKGTGSVIYSASRAAADLNYQVTNSDNTSGTSNAGFQAAVGGGSAGDAYSQYAVSGVTTWTTGVDNSASDAYVIAASNTLGTSNAASWSTAGALTNSGAITSTAGAITATNGNLVLGTSGNKIISSSVATTTTAGDNSFGSVTLVGGTATVSTTAVTANSLIYIWRQSIGATGAAALGMLAIGTITASTSFIINALQTADATALQASDVSVVGWMIVN